ncbi:N-alpha-acetyltransferase 25, NatB auxiliary subunit [Anabrus simplex]|uniref:N-alpha-acetyltransferase 25, NatB auxiliary subunit n=1 Tax=Anabrus simplex TaxID=316456 RepID=UPI0035A30514
MAARTHVDSSVGERRLRPIYDWLDSGNNKKALQEAEKVLKKQPNFLCAKVLKGLALLRLGKEDECEQLLDAVRAEVPADDSTLQAMTICYRELHKPERICEIYEAATKKDPNNEELLTHLFMAYVRIADYKRQQQTALALYKLKPKNPYYFWAVMSIVMQAYKADGSLAKSVVLPLAERMVTKFVSEGKIEAEQEVQLYLMILEMQGKFEEALQVVEGPLGEKLVSYVFVPLKRASLLMKLGRWRETNLLYKLMLKEDMDRWSYITDYLTSALKLFDSGQQNNNNNNNVVEGDALWEVVDSSPEMCRNFLELLVHETERQSLRLRGPYLARLELYKILTERGEEPKELYRDVVELLMAYVKNFSEKPCCVSDLRRFLPLLPSERRDEFIEKVRTLVGLKEGEFPATVKQMQQHVCSLQLARTIGLHLEMSIDERIALVQTLLLYYQHGMQFNTENLQTEFAYNDPYALLMAHLLYDVWRETKSSTYLRQAVTILELALARSPSNFHIKLLLVRFYSLLGVGAAAHQVYELLDIKHMQLDSLGYFHCGHVYTSGQLAATLSLYENTLKFFTNNYKDSVDHLTFSYKFGSFLKIEEFVEFRERLNNSLHYALTTVERMLLDLMSCTGHSHTCQMVHGMEITPWKDNVNWDTLQDNRDTAVVISWEPPSRQLSEEDTKKTFSDDVDLLRLRSLILRCLGAAVEASVQDPSDKSPQQNNGLVNGEDKDGGRAGTLGRVCEELSREYQALLVRHQGDVPKDVVSSPLPSRLHGYLSSPVCHLLMELLAVVRALAQGEEESHDLPRLTATAGEVMTSSVNRVATHIKNLENKSDRLAERRLLLERVVLTVEMISMAALLCGVGQTLLKPFKVPLVKKGKKKKDSCSSHQMQSPPSRQLECFNRMVSEIHNAAETLDQALDFWEAMLSEETASEELASQLCSLTLATGDRDSLPLPSFSETVRTKITDGLKGSLKEIRQLVQVKLRYVASAKV